MLKKIGLIVLLLAALAGMSGCDAGLIMGSRAVGVRSGEFIYKDGYVVSFYKESLERVWQAAEAVVKEMKAYDIAKDKKIAKGTIIGLISEEKITIKVEYQERDRTSVAILVGMGSKIASSLIHDKITQKLTAP